MKCLLIAVVCILLGSIPEAARGAGDPEYGPAKGTLIIIGGGSLKGTGILETFLRLAGGKDARLVVVPTAGGNKNADGSIRLYDENKVVAPWKKLGFKQVRMLHTHDPKEADTREFAAALADVTAVWFEGGRQWNLVDSYLNTRTHREFRKVLQRGGVIAGTSAGATIQGDYLVRGAVAGPHIIMTPEKEHERGFNFLRKTAIDQHINTRMRWDDLIPVIKKYPDLLGIGLSEGTAIIVKGDRFEVMGAWKVAVHDNQKAYQPWEKPYYVLSRGDVYDMKSRRIERYGNGTAAPVDPGLSPKARDPVSPGSKATRMKSAQAEGHLAFLERHAVFQGDFDASQSIVQQGFHPGPCPCHHDARGVAGRMAPGASHLCAQQHQSTDLGCRKVHVPRLTKLRDGWLLEDRPRAMRAAGLQQQSLDLLLRAE